MTFAAHLTNALRSASVTPQQGKCPTVRFDSLKSSRRRNRASKTRFNYVQAQRDTFGYASYGFRGHWSVNLLSLEHLFDRGFSGLILSPWRTAMSANQNPYSNIIPFPTLPPTTTEQFIRHLRYDDGKVTLAVYEERMRIIEILLGMAV